MCPAVPMMIDFIVHQFSREHSAFSTQHSAFSTQHSAGKHSGEGREGFFTTEARSHGGSQGLEIIARRVATKTFETQRNRGNRGCAEKTGVVRRLWKSPGTAKILNCSTPSSAMQPLAMQSLPQPQCRASNRIERSRQ